MKRFAKICVIFGLVVCLLATSMPIFFAGGASATTAQAASKAVKVKSVKLDKKKLTAYLGTTYTLKATVSPSNAKVKTVTWKSSNTKIATIKNGKITPKKAGKTTITVTTKDGKKTAKCTVTVKENPNDPSGTRRAVLIGNSNYTSGTSSLPGCFNDPVFMGLMLKNGGFKEKNIAIFKDLRGDLLDFALNYISVEDKDLWNWGKIKDNDLTVVYYSGHGAAHSDKVYRGALVGVDNYIVTVDSVRKALEKIPGTVVFISDSCLSGQYITTKKADITQTSPKALSQFRDDSYTLRAASKTDTASRGLDLTVKERDGSIISTEEYNQSIINAFAGAEKAALTASSQKKKFHIIVACKPMESSYEYGKAKYPVGAFTYALTMGGGYNVDKHNNNKLSAGVTNLLNKKGTKTATTKQLYDFTVKKIKEIGYNKQQDGQNAMLWPTKDKLVLLKRK